MVVGDVVERERVERPQPTTVATVIDADERVVLGERLVGGEELQVGRGGPAVQQHDGRGGRVGVAMSADEELAPPLHPHDLRGRHPGQLERMSVMRQRPSWVVRHTRELLKPDTDAFDRSQQTHRVESGVAGAHHPRRKEFAGERGLGERGRRRGAGRPDEFRDADDERAPPTAGIGPTDLDPEGPDATLRMGPTQHREPCRETVATVGRHRGR